ncbi:MAG: hypothetical protein Q9159_007419 [Coniocarpon cinnabarinum]
MTFSQGGSLQPAGKPTSLRRYSPKLWHATLLTYAAVVVAILCTALVGEQLPRVENGLLVVYVLGFFGVLVSIVSLAPHGSAKDVFATFLNEGGWSTQTLSVFVGLPGNAFAFLVPRTMVWGLVINGVVGLSMDIAVLFSAGDIDKALNSDYVYPFIEVVMQALDSRAGTAIVVAVIIVVDVALVIGVVAASSRMLWSFARDRGVPFWKQVQQVGRKSTIPLLAIFITITITMILNLISISSTVAFNDVVSLTVSTLYASYLVACVLLLWRRLEGSIHVPDSYSHDAFDVKGNTPGSSGQLHWGPWRVKEPLGTLLNLFACVYLTIVFIFSFFPPSTPVSPGTMNYSVLVSGFVAIASGFYYALVARKTYVGPLIEVHAD